MPISVYQGVCRFVNRVQTAWAHGAMRGSNQAKHCMEGMVGQVGFPADLAGQVYAETRELPAGRTFTCITCATEGLRQYVHCENAPTDEPERHGLQCADCARTWCHVYKRRQCPSCRDANYSSRCLRKSSRLTFMSGDDWDREAGRLLGFLGVEGAKEMVSNFIADINQRSAAETISFIERVGLKEYMESIAGTPTLLWAMEQLREMKVIAGSKFAAKIACMSCGALLELGACLLFIILVDIYQLFAGRQQGLSEMTVYALSKIPYILLVEIIAGAGGVGGLLMVLIQEGLMISSKCIYYIWMLMSTLGKFLYLKVTGDEIGNTAHSGTNIFNQPDDWSVAIELSRRRESASSGDGSNSGENGRQCAASS